VCPHGITELLPLDRLDATANGDRDRAINANNEASKAKASTALLAHDWHSRVRWVRVEVSHAPTGLPGFTAAKRPS
jgi:hypothetical protein